ncbi:MAG: ATP-dependent 6-phosphofructokinase [Candidatus Latescibacterota bacterium]
MDRKRIGILTGGGDAPGLNAVIRAVTVKGISLGYEVVGFKDGWRGLLKQQHRPLTLADVEDIHMLGGTILGSSRTNIAKVENGFEIAKKNLADAGIYALIAAGGDDTLGVALKLYRENFNVIGVPKTIDNDVNATDYTFGFDTAINRVCEFMEMLRTTTKSHSRVMVVEIMGRHAGWIGLHGGMAGGAHMILIPEVEVKLSDICQMVKRRYESGNTWAIIAVSEGAIIPEIMEEVSHSSQLDSFGHVQLGTGKGIAENLAHVIERETGYETRSIVLGHLQRGGNPSAFDRVLGTRLGIHAVEMIDKGQFGMMASLKGGEMKEVHLEEAVGSLRTVEPYKYDDAKLFFS